MSKKQVTVREASDSSLLTSLLSKLGVMEKTEEEKKSYEARIARLQAALKQHQAKRAKRK